VLIRINNYQILRVVLAFYKKYKKFS
jgi:hypothetical protein